MQAVISSPSQVSVNVLAGTFTAPLSKPSPDALIAIDFPTFGYSTIAPLLEFSASADFRQITAKFALDENVLVTFRLFGETRDGRRMWPREAVVDFEIRNYQARAHFVAATFFALLALAESINLRFPGSEDIQLASFAAPGEVGSWLKRRQIAYRLMVVERAFDRAIPLLPTFNEELLSLAYYAVVERNVAWPFWQAPFPHVADQEALTLLNKIEVPSSFSFEIDCVLDTLGTILDLGKVIRSIKNGIIVNADEVRSELAQLDGHGFQVIIRSLDGAANNHFPNAPRLPAEPWDAQIKELIELEEELDQQFFQSVNQLAADSLSGLAAAEIAVLTERPHLDDEAFNDFDIEDAS